MKTLNRIKTAVKEYFQAIGAAMVSGNLKELLRMEENQYHKLCECSPYIKETWIYKHNESIMKLKSEWINFLIELFRLDLTRIEYRPTDFRSKSDEQLSLLTVTTPFEFRELESAYNLTGSIETVGEMSRTARENGISLNTLTESAADGVFEFTKKFGYSSKDAAEALKITVTKS